MRIWHFLSRLAFAFLFFSLPADAASQPKRVLVLHSFGLNFWPGGETAEHFRTELIRQSPEPIDLFEMSLATARFGNDPQEGPFVEYLRALFVDRPIDLVVAVGGPAANFFQRYRQQLFPRAPLLLSGADQRTLGSAGLTANDAAVTTDIDLAAIFNNILTVLPGTNDIVIVIGNSPLEKFWVEQVGRVTEPFKSRVRFSWWNDLSFDEMLKRVATLPPRSAVFFGLLVVDAAGVPHYDGKALPRLLAATNAPIFNHFDSYFGTGNVGGPMLTISEVSRLSAQGAIRILAGEPPGDIHFPSTRFGAPRFDWREMQRWGIKEANLPAGSIIEFRQPTFWSQNRGTVIGALAIVFAQAALIGWLLFEHHRRSLAEIEAENRRREVIHLNRAATATVLSSSIAHELSQPLGAALNNTEAAEILLNAEQPDLKEIREILADIRYDNQRAGDIIHRLGKFLKKGDVDLQTVDLNNTVREVVGIAAGEATKRGIMLSAIQTAVALPVRADHIHLQQVLLNLVMNGIDALENCELRRRCVTIQTFRIGESRAEVTVSDSGKGIPEENLRSVFDAFFTTKPRGTGLGLPIARTIIEGYGGTLRAENRDGGGAMFRFTLALA